VTDPAALDGITTLHDFEPRARAVMDHAAFDYGLRPTLRLNGFESITFAVFRY